MSESSANRNELNLKELVGNLVEIAKYWWKHKITIGWFTLLFGIGGFTYAHLTKEITHISRTTFVLEGGAPATGLSGLVTQMGLGTGGASSLFSNDNVLLLLRSKRILEGALLADYVNNPDSNLYNRYVVRTFPDAVADKTVALLSADKPRESFTRTEDSTLEVVLAAATDMIATDRLDKRSNIIEIIVKGIDERWTLDFSKALLQEFSNLQTVLKVGKIKSSIAVLENRLDSIQGALNAAMYGVAQEYDQSLGIIQAKPRVSSRKKEMETQLLSALYGEVYKTLEMTRYSLDREEPLLEILDVPRMPLPKEGKGRVKFGLLGAFVGLVLVSGFFIVKYILKDLYE